MTFFFNLACLNLVLIWPRKPKSQKTTKIQKSIFNYSTPQFIWKWATLGQQILQLLPSVLLVHPQYEHGKSRQHKFLVEQITSKLSFLLFKLISITSNYYYFSMQTTRRLLTMAYNTYWSFPNVQLCRNNSSTASWKSKVCIKLLFTLFLCSILCLVYMYFHIYLIYFPCLYSYGVCIRNEANYCCIQYSLCSDANSFTLDNTQATQAKQDEACSLDYIEIGGEL